MKFSQDDAGSLMPIVCRYKIRRLPPDASDWGPDCEDELRRGNALWNKLVELDREFERRYAAIVGEGDAVAAPQAACDEAAARKNEALQAWKKARSKERTRRVDPALMGALRAAAAELKACRKTLRDAKKEARGGNEERLKALEEERRQAVAELRRGSGVYWATANAIVQKFETARRDVLKKRGSGQAAEMSFRRYDGGRIVNQYTGGGLTLAEFGERFSEDGMRITAYSRPGGEARELRRTRRGKEEIVQWRPRGEQRALTVALAGRRDASEPLPDLPGLRVKSVELRLRLNPDWHPLMPPHERWLRSRDRSSLVVTATVPKEAMPPPPPPREELVAVNLGWRYLDNGDIRVATIVGADGIPDFIILPRAWTDFYVRARELQGTRDRALDAVRPLVRRVPWREMPHQDTAEFGGRLASAPKFGQRALARLVVVWYINAPDWRREDWEPLEEWRQEDNRMRSEQRAAERRLYGRRRDLYRCAAKALALRAGTILLDKMDIARMVRLPDVGEHALEQAARRNRWLVAPGELRTAIINAARKNARIVAYQEGPSSFVCPVDPSHDVGEKDRSLLYFTCYECRDTKPGIDLWDQDVANCIVRLRRWIEHGPDSPEEEEPLTAE